MAEYVGGKTAPWSSAFPWLTEYPITQHWAANGETGIDLGTHYHTRITSLTAGQVLGTGVYDGGCVVSVSGEIGGRVVAVYYQHLDEIASGIAPGVAVKIGQLLGWSGGQLAGGAHPSTRRYSSGPHIEVGIDAPYGGMWNPKGYGPNINPLPWLNSVAIGANGPTAFVAHLPSNAGATVVQVSTAPGFLPVAQAIHDHETFRSLRTGAVFAGLIHDGSVVAWRGMIVFIGLLILASALYHALQPAYNRQTQLANNAVVPLLTALA